MRNTDTLESLAAQLRQSIASQAYAEAQNLLPGYFDLVQRTFRNLPPSSPEAAAVANGAKDLYQWMMRSVLLDRAHCAADLQRLSGLSSYLEPQSRTPHTYELQG